MNAHRQAAARNLALYPWYVGGLSVFGWMPVFFLYMASRVSLSEVLLLEAIYYFSVVLLELPSGYFSDRVGRRPTLIIAAGALTASYLGFALSDSFAGLAWAQVALATGLAFNSGTDTSFHYANLSLTGDSERYPEREARLGAMAFVVSASGALVGGMLGGLDMRLAYGLSALGALTSLGCALAFSRVHEEAHDTDASAPDAERGVSFTTSMRACVRLIGERTFGWLFIFSVMVTVLNHVPYEFYQPYLAQLSQGTAWGEARTPWIAGVHVALVQIIAAPTARLSARFSRRLGIVTHLMGSALIQLALITIMALWLHPIVALLLLGRSIPRALQEAPLRAAIAPHVAPSLRATYLSLQSLAGRLYYASVLTALSRLEVETFSSALTVAAGFSAVLWVCVGVSARILRPTVLAEDDQKR